MVTTICLVTCALTMSQAPDRTSWVLTPQLVRGQELVYTGTYREEALSPGVQFQRHYKLETTLLVLGGSTRKWDVAVLTVLTKTDPRPGQATPPTALPASVRLEMTEFDVQGRMEATKAKAFAVPLDGPPTIEWGAIVEAPRVRVGADGFWEVPEEGRPPRTWRVSGTEMVSGTTCVKLVGTQQSHDWDRPRADRGAWRRRDTVWFAPQQGLAYRVERVLERRDAARSEATHRSTVRYDLDNRLTYPGKLFDDRVQEITSARRFIEEAAPLLRQPAQQRPQLEALLKKIALHVKGQPTAVGPYRKAVLHVQRRVEAALRGEVVADPLPEHNLLPTAVAVGQRVPDFVVTELINNQSVRLYRLLGRPVLILFYNPSTETGIQVLDFAQKVCTAYRQGVTVLGMAVTDNPDLVRRQYEQMRLQFPILDGKGLHLTYGVDATPRLIVLDADGILRGAYTGWGDQTSAEVARELQRWLPPR
jgi:peroxiredoxin